LQEKKKKKKEIFASVFTMKDLHISRLKCLFTKEPMNFSLLRCQKSRLENK